MARANVIARARLDASESQITQTVIAWCRLRRDEARDTLHIPNEGKRSPRTGARLKREGMMPGSADLFVPAARGGKHGLWLELKRRGEKPTLDQLAFLDRMAAHGYSTSWADNVDDAIACITEYMRA